MKKEREISLSLKLYFQRNDTEMSYIQLSGMHFIFGNYKGGNSIEPKQDTTEGRLE